MANREIKFRVWNKVMEEMFCPDWDELAIRAKLSEMILMQYLMLTDSEDTEIYIGDILEFENGDRIVIKMEEWLEPFAEAIGEPECEDQWRDLYRIERAKIIGNIYETPHLLK